MENATNYHSGNGHSGNGDFANLDVQGADLDEWLEVTNAEQLEAKQNRRNKKRHKPLRKNRKPSRPANYIGQRSNNHLQRMFGENDDS